MIPNHGLSDFDRLQRGSPSPMASFDMMANNRGTGFNGWNDLPHDVSNCNFVNLRIAPPDGVPVFGFCILLPSHYNIWILFFPIVFREYDQICLAIQNLFLPCLET